MDSPTLHCKREWRRRFARTQGWSGIDFVEVMDPDQRELCVYFFGDIPEHLTKENVRIEGGHRIRGIEVVKVHFRSAAESEDDDCLLVTLNKAGDFSTYTLRLLKTENKDNERPYKLDPRYAEAEFSFKVDCPSELDCKGDAICPPEKRDEPEINYLAKDYSSFRQLILDRLALIMPEWRERHIPDIGITLVELLAYVGDYLSYHQDAVATEAYLDTARRRISVRRHARLVDYYVHEGCNSRAWLIIETDNANSVTPPIKLQDFYFTTGPVRGSAEAFEPVLKDPSESRQFFGAHVKIDFYTWGNEECCLPRGAVAATLEDEWLEDEPELELRPAGDRADRREAAQQRFEKSPKSPGSERKLHLEKGDVLIFEEVIGPRTGDPRDADPTRRHPVRITKVEKKVDPLKGIPVVEIEWAMEDALPFPFCLSAKRPAPDCASVTKISVARGNVILVDHGQTLDPEGVGQVHGDTVVGECACEGSIVEMTYVPALFRPWLKQKPLTFSQPLPERGFIAASLSLKQDVREALPQIKQLIGLPGICNKPDDEGEPKTRDGIDPTESFWRWYPQRDLLGSQSEDQHFVVEIDNDGIARLRFGDGELGRTPEACMIFKATYRIGNGAAGNVAADTITNVVWRSGILEGANLRARNPLPAQGGTDPEPLSEVKLFAPRAFRKRLERAVTVDDYAQIVMDRFGERVQRAGASLRWTGNWYEVQVAIDPKGSETADESLFDEIKRYLYRYRRIGHDLKVQQARYIPLKIELQVCVLAHYLRGHVEAALLDLLSSRQLADGRLGFFHPDNLTFGEGIYISKLVAAAQNITGVASVEVITLQRLGEVARGELEQGLLPLGPLEVAQLDNDPSFPERGMLKLTIGGGR